MCPETLALCSNEGSPGGRGQKGPGRTGGARRYEQQHNMVPLGFVLCGEVNSTLESSYGWGVSDVSSLWILSSLWELSSVLKAVFHLCYSRVPLHHSDRFCSLACWDITVSDPLCPAWLILQSACSEVTCVGDWNLTILLAFLISLASMRKQGNKCRSNEFSIN